jgi:[ribosomal protein S5]-alanine N-acetyltransferase
MSINNFPVHNYLYNDNLEGERIRTRFVSENDIGAWAGFFKDPEAIELFHPAFMAPGGKSRDNAELWIKRQIERYRDNHYGLQAVIEKKSGAFLGLTGLLLQEVDGVKELEVGYHILKKHWGNGYAPEAARLFVDFAFKNRLNDSVVSIIDIRNHKSQRVAEKNGLKKEKQTTWRDKEVFVYRISEH